MNILRYTAILPVTVIAWVFALFVTLRINFYRTILFCPENVRAGTDCYLVDWVTYPWWLVSFGAAFAALLVILVATLMAPSHKFRIALYTYLFWGVVATVLALFSGYIIPYVFAVSAGGLLILFVSHLEKAKSAMIYEEHV